MFKTLCIVLLAAATAYASWGGGFRYPGFGQWSRHSYQPYISLGNGVFAGYDGFNSFGGHGGYHGPGHFGGFGFGGGFGGGYGGGFGGGFGGFGKY
ncbi:hypothetical protein ScPMuIL_014349 [Solemya velum]